MIYTIPAFAYSYGPPARGLFLTTESATILFTDVVGLTELSRAPTGQTADEVGHEKG